MLKKLYSHLAMCLHEVVHVKNVNELSKIQIHTETPQHQHFMSAETAPPKRENKKPNPSGVEAEPVADAASRAAWHRHPLCLAQGGGEDRQSAHQAGFSSASCAHYGVLYPAS